MNVLLARPIRRLPARSMGAAALLCLLAHLPVSLPAAGQDMNGDAARDGPRSSASVYWVGHSLMESKADSPAGVIDLMSLVGVFAKSKGLRYEMGDHTLWGSPLSALWRGRPHSYERDAAEMAVRRERFEREAGRYDTIVLTEATPVSAVMRPEYSAYYLRRFYCAAKTANPNARVYLYQTWARLQGYDPDAGDPPPYPYDWRRQMMEERPHWERLADLASRPDVREPGWLGFFRLHGTDAGCLHTDPIFIIPVGPAMTALADRIADPRPEDAFMRADGAAIALADLFANPYTGGQGAQNGVLRDPGKEHDDIHPSALGIYYAALVHFAAIYRQSPAGLPDLLGLGQPAARTLQCIAWETVLADPRSGVEGDKDC